MPGFKSLGYQLTENLNGSVSIQYTPTIPGIHKLNIECNGIEVEATPIWCVVQRAEYGYITSYGPRLLDILGQPGFAEVLDQEGLVITTDGENIIVSKEGAPNETANIEAGTEIMEVDQSTSEALQSVLESMTGLEDKADVADSTVSEDTVDLTTGVSSVCVKLEPNHDDSLYAAVRTARIQNSDTINRKKDMFLCPYKGCPKMYAKEIYALECEKDHYIKQVRGRKPKSKQSSNKQRTATQSGDCEMLQEAGQDDCDLKTSYQIENATAEDSVQLAQTDNNTDDLLSDAITRNTEEQQVDRKEFSEKIVVVNSIEESQETKEGNIGINDPAVETVDIKPVVVKKRGRPPKKVASQSNDVKSETLSHSEKVQIKSTPKSDNRGKRMASTSPDSSAKRTKRTPKPTWKLLEMDLSIVKQERIDSDEDDVEETQTEEDSPTAKKPGRPSKSLNTPSVDETQKSAVKRRGRPPKVKELGEANSGSKSVVESTGNKTIESVHMDGEMSNDLLKLPDTPAARKRGRPKKTQDIEEKQESDTELTPAIRIKEERLETPSTVKRGRGRPRKNDVLVKYDDADYENSSTGDASSIHGTPTGRILKRCDFDGCQRVFNSASARSKHIRRVHHGERIDQTYYLKVRRANIRRAYRPRDRSSTHELITARGIRQLPGQGYGCWFEDCPRVFRTPSARSKHVRRLHLGQDIDKDRNESMNERGEYPCDYPGCSKVLASVNSWDKHIRRVHLGEPVEAEKVYDIVFRCKFIGCGRIYTTPGTLRKHIKMSEHFMDGESDEEGVRPDVEESSDEENPIPDDNIDNDTAIQLGEMEKPVEVDTEGVADSQTTPDSQDNTVLEVLMCDFERCGKIFKKAKYLARHKDSHDKFPFQCDKEECKKMFRFEESLSVHKFSYHGMQDETKRFECELCDIKKKFSSWCLLKKHQRVHTFETPYQCQDCLQRFKWQTSLLTHACINKSGEGSALACKECGKVFNMRSHLQKHMAKHNEDRPYKCDNCPRAFKFRELLTKHYRKSHMTELERRIYAEKRGWICPDCDRICLSYRDFERHKTRHSDVRPYICDQCAGQFKTQDGLNAHIKQMHSVTLFQREDGTVEEVHTLNYFSCDYPDCDKKFRRHHMYLEHKKIHYSEERFPCDQPGCHKTYPTIFKLKEHKRCVHSDKPPVYCEVCGKVMKNTSSLANHMKLHEGQQNRLACTIPGCDKTFSVKTTLDRHILMKHQTPPKLFECLHEGCSRTFRLKSLLESHMQSHLLDRNYHCTICGSSFKTIGTLKSHEKTHDRTQQYQCSLCMKYFPRKKRYLEHLARQHENEIHYVQAGEPMVVDNIEHLEHIEDGKQLAFLKPTVIQAINDAISNGSEVQMSDFIVSQDTVHEVDVDQAQEIIYQLEDGSKSEIIYQVEHDNKSEIIYQVQGDGDSEIVYQLEGDDVKHEIIYQDSQIITEVKPELVYQDAIMMPDSQIIEFATNYQ